ncbi:hypothetical protein K432DRAFT_203299 [Lepidopterella palustris CBS 459.81]|uniref:Transmembrane protein n=1 Tax=Lepidopterella palustris CBS 459.81 TaxID=1314670 RepID=A0A8E2JHR0_9PEZI|nr:hypothetical protein K432DRAFT_203299 [Lepidopterella palustris CBS 459.81]
MPPEFIHLNGPSLNNQHRSPLQPIISTHSHKHTSRQYGIQNPCPQLKHLTAFSTFLVTFPHRQQAYASPPLAKAPFFVPSTVYIDPTPANMFLVRSDLPGLGFVVLGLRFLSFFLLFGSGGYIGVRCARRAWKPRVDG